MSEDANTSTRPAGSGCSESPCSTVTGYLKNYKDAPFGDLTAPLESVILMAGRERIAEIPANLLRQIANECGFIETGEAGV